MQSMGEPGCLPTFPVDRPTVPQGPAGAAAPVVPVVPGPFDSDRLSHYRTKHHFAHYAEFASVDEYKKMLAYARERRLPVFILGNGSNTLFNRATVKSVVLKNRMPREVRDLGDERYYVSASEQVSAVLKHCRTNSLDSFYYLASVPAMVGGALAMNAGRGREHNVSIFDFVESIDYLDGDRLVTLPRAQVELDYRSTIFTGVQTRLILGATFRFPKVTLESDPIVDRVLWSKDKQDLVGGNCGSVFKQYHTPTLSRLRGLKLGGASFSAKTVNWINNTGESPKPIRTLIRIAKLAHFMLGKCASVELIQVD